MSAKKLSDRDEHWLGGDQLDHSPLVFDLRADTRPNRDVSPFENFK